MTVYYITIALVLLFGYLAEYYDSPQLVGEDRLSVQHTSETGFFYFLLAAVLIFVAGFRYRVGTDYGAYYYGYVDYIKNLPNALREIDEPGYGFLALIASKVYNNGASAIFIASLVTVGLPFFVIYRHTDKLLLAGLLYVAMGCWHISFNGVRQCLAASVLFCGFGYLKNRQFVRYCIVVFVAFLFHRSALVMAFIYFAVYRKINAQNILLMIVLAWVILQSYSRVFAFANIIMEKDYSLENAYVSTEVNRLRVIASCLPTVVFLFAYWGQEPDENTTFHLNLSIIHSAICVFTMNSAVLYRIGIYSIIFQTIAIPELLKGISEKNRRIITAGIVIMFVGMWWYEIFSYGSLNHFQWIWQK